MTICQFAPSVQSSPQSPHGTHARVFVFFTISGEHVSQFASRSPAASRKRSGGTLGFRLIMRPLDGPPHGNGCGRSANSREEETLVGSSLSGRNFVVSSRLSILSASHLSVACIRRKRPRRGDDGVPLTTMSRTTLVSCASSWSRERLSLAASSRSASRPSSTVGSSTSSSRWLIVEARRRRSRARAPDRVSLSRNGYTPIRHWFTVGTLICSSIRVSAGLSNPQRALTGNESGAREPKASSRR